MTEEKMPGIKIIKFWEGSYKRVWLNKQKKHRGWKMSWLALIGKELFIGPNEASVYTLDLVLEH